MFVIERHHNSALVYFSDLQSKPEWSTQFDKAIKFADRDSAARFLAHALDGIGNVVEHSYADNK